MSSFTAVDLSRLPAPEIVEQLDFEVIFAQMLTHLRTLDQQFDALTESDPAYKLLQVAAYREMLLRQRANDSVRAVMLAYAKGTDLDHLAALFSVTRYVLDPGNPALGIPPTYESDADLRRRVQLSPEGFSVAGPEGAYIFHSLNAHADVLDASAYSPPPADIIALVMGILASHAASQALIDSMSNALSSAAWPGDVVVSVLSRNGRGEAAQELLSAVYEKLSAGNVRPLTDHVIVQSAEVIDFEVVARVYTYAGPDSALVIAESRKQLQAYIKECHRLGRDITLSGIYSVLHGEGVQRVEIISPTADIVADRTQTTYCTRIDVTHGGIDE